jgi:magnesium transporter
MNRRDMVVNCAAYAGGRRLRDIRIDEIGDALKEEGSFVWIGLLEPDEKLMKQVQHEFKLHDLAVEDAHRAHQRPKVEAYGDCLFVALHTAQLIGGDVHFGETHLFVGPRYVVSVRHGASASYAAVRQRCESAPDLLARGPGFVVYAIMDFVVDNYMPIVDALEDELETVEDQIFKASYRRKTTERLYQLKRRVTALRRAVFPLLEVSTQVARSGSLIPEDTQPYFRDVHDHVLRINDATENMREMLTTALHVNLSLVSVGQNEVMKRLAGWGAILAVPTMVASYYGMNFEFMPELHWQYGYPLAVGITAVVCLLLYRRLKRADWL